MCEQNESRQSCQCGCQRTHPTVAVLLMSPQPVHTTCTVVILINATTLMHKSALSTNNFGNNHFGQKYQQ